MTSEEKVAKTVHDNLSSVYCDTCRHWLEGIADDSCYYCNRDTMRWGVSGFFCNLLARKVIDTIKEDKQGV